MMVEHGSDILLVVVPPWDVEKPSLGVAFLATFLKSIHVTVEVLDINIEFYNKCPEGIKRKWNNHDALFWLEEESNAICARLIDDMVEDVLAYDSKILGFSVNTSNSIYFLRELLKKIKLRAPEKIIIVGGPGCFHEHERKVLEENRVDFFVIGKGEFALQGLLWKLGAIDYKGAPDICTITKEGKNHFCVEGVKQYSLDSMPLPTFEEFRLTSYSQEVFPILWNEGCIRNCAFCLDRLFSGEYRPGNVSRVIEAIKFYIRKYGMKNFRFVDNLINGDLNNLALFCTRIINENIEVSWDGQIVVRPDMDKPFFERLKKAGCRRLDLGVESFSDRVLGYMRKGFLSDDAVRNIIDAKSVGLEVSIFIIVGFPGEEESDFEKTIANIRDYRQYIDAVGSLTLSSVPFGTDMYINPAKYNIASQDRQVLKEFWLKWRTIDNSNNFQIRLKRLQRLSGVLNELKIPYKDNFKLVS